MKRADEYLRQAVDLKASDLHITVAQPPVFRVDGQLTRSDGPRLSPADTLEIVQEVTSEKQFAVLSEKGELDFSYSIPKVGRYRVNAYRQRGSYGAAFRVVIETLPSMEDLGLPPVVAELARKRRGLILVTGPTGSGKSTTLAAMINQINKERSCHILTLEDPIEYLHKHNKSMVNQREVGGDTLSFSNGLRAALREDPDVILVGEMRDLDTIAIAITAAETGHLVLSTLHTIGATNTIDRIIDVFPTYQQQQVRLQLSSTLEGIISQQLLAKQNQPGRVAAFEVMTSTGAIRNLIREGKSHQLMTNVQTGSKFGMQTMDSSLLNLYNRSLISRDTCLTYCVNLDYVKSQLGIFS